MRIKGQKTMKARLLEGEVLFGTFYKFNCHPLVEMLGLAGMDFIIVDGEHADYSYSDMQGMVRTANGLGMNAVVRVPSVSEENILHAGDMGAQGIQVPNVQSVAEAAFAAEHMRYYPAGKRGLGLTTRASGYTFGSNEEYVRYVNEELLGVIMIENMAMAAQVEAVCQIPQIDVIFIGPGDLSQSLGKPGKLDDPEVLKQVKAIAQTALAHGKMVGVYAGTLEDVQRYTSWGIQMIAYSSEMVMIAAKFKEVMAQLNQIRGESANR